MAIAIVGSPHPFTASAAQLNPSVTLNSVAANNTLFLLAAQLSTTDPGWPTDTKGNAYVPIGDGGINQAGHTPLSEIMAFCLRALAGNTKITVTTTTASCGVALEIAGVATPVTQVDARGRTYQSPPVPDDICSRNCPSGTGLTCDINPRGINGSLVLAMAVVSGSNTLTFGETGWTSLGSGSVNGITFDAQSIITPGPESLALAWGQATPADGLVLAVSFPAA